MAYIYLNITRSRWSIDKFRVVIFADLTHEKTAEVRVRAQPPLIRRTVIVNRDRSCKESAA